MKSKPVSDPGPSILGCLVSLAGRLAEIVWIIVYGTMTGTTISLPFGISAVTSFAFAMPAIMISPIAFGVAIQC